MGIGLDMEHGLQSRVVNTSILSIPITLTSLVTATKTFHDHHIVTIEGPSAHFKTAKQSRAK